MKIVSVEWKNFNSYGNSPTRIDFDNGGDLFLLLGGNGNGKSTISEVITFCLYGKLEKKNKGDLPNRLNKNLWCRIIVISKNKKIMITRGVSPGLFEVEIDGAPYETSGNSNVQDYLEYEIFDIPYQVFKNIIVLSINDFRSFLTMSPGDKRNIVDRLFGFTLINQMKDSIKTERKEIRDTLKTLIDELSILDDSIQSINEKLDSLEKSKKEDNLRLASEYKQKIIDLLTSKKKLDETIKLINEKSQSINTTLDGDKKIYYTSSQKLKTVNSQLSLYDSHSMCPTCSSSLEGEDHQHIKEDLLVKKTKLSNENSDLKTSIEELSTKLNKINSKYSELQESAISLQSKIIYYKNEAEKLVKESNELDSNYLNQLIVENQQKISERKSSHIKNQLEDNFLETVEQVLGEDGVKNLAMKTILPSLNQNISSMAKQIHLPYSIKFDDKFNCVINSLGEEIKPQSMSTGERKKADFIIIIAMLKLLKIRYPSLNLLFLDEIFSSVDSSGVYEIIKILSEVSKENKINTWVINHTELPMELFDKRVEAYREGGFSKLRIETIS